MEDLLSTGPTPSSFVKPDEIRNGTIFFCDIDVTKYAIIILSFFLQKRSIVR